jgi:hypothetical protein
MTWINKARAMGSVAAIAATAIVAFGMMAGTAQARWDHDYHGYNYGWTGGYYGAPPVVYGDPYAYGYYPPPGVGINLPGVSIGIR